MRSLQTILRHTHTLACVGVCVAVASGCQAPRPGASALARAVDVEPAKAAVPIATPKPRSRWAAPFPQGNTLNAVWVDAQGDAFAVGEGGTLVRYRVAASEWDVRELANVTLTAIWGAEDGALFAGGERGTLLVSRDRGATWAAARTPSDFCVRAISGCGSELYVVGSDGRLLHSPDRGHSFGALRVPGAPATARQDPWPNYAAPDLMGVQCSTDGRATVIVAEGAIVTSTDHGKSWQRRDVSPAELRTVASRGGIPGLGFIHLAATKDALLILSEIGVPAKGEALPTDRWAHVIELRDGHLEPWRAAMVRSEVVDKTLATAPLGAVAFSVFPSGRATLVTQWGTYFSDVGEAVWHEPLPSASGAPIPQQAPSLLDLAGDEATLHAVGSWGQWLVSKDTGRSWQRVSGIADALRGLWADPPHVVAAGRAIVESADGGKTWTAPRKLGKSSFTTTAAWGHAEERYLAGAPGFLYSADAGKTFNSANLGLEGHLITSAVDGIDEQTVLLAGSVHDKRTGAALSGVILRGSGLTFSRVLEVKAPPVKFGFPRVFTSLDARDESRLYAGGIGGILYRSRDRGATWEKLPELMPEEDIAAVHAGKGETLWALTALPADSRATRLWASHDGGMSFVELRSPRAGAHVTAIGGSAQGELVIAADGRVYEQDSERGTFSELSVGAHAASTPILKLAVPSRGRVYASGDMGVLLVMGEDGTAPDRAAE